MAPSSSSLWTRWRSVCPLPGSLSQSPSSTSLSASTSQAGPILQPGFFAMISMTAPLSGSASNAIRLPALAWLSLGAASMSWCLRTVLMWGAFLCFSLSRS